MILPDLMDDRAPLDYDPRPSEEAIEAGERRKADLVTRAWESQCERAEKFTREIGGNWTAQTRDEVFELVAVEHVRALRPGLRECGAGEILFPEVQERGLPGGGLGSISLIERIELA